MNLDIETLEYVRCLLETRIQTLLEEQKDIDVKIKELEYTYQFLGEMIREEQKEEN